MTTAELMNRKDIVKLSEFIGIINNYSLQLSKRYTQNKDKVSGDDKKIALILTEQIKETLKLLQKYAVIPSTANRHTAYGIKNLGSLCEKINSSLKSIETVEDLDAISIQMINLGKMLLTIQYIAEPVLSGRWISSL